MSRGQDTSEFVKGQIFALRFIANFKIKDIAEAVECSEAAVQKYCYRASTERKLTSSRHNCRGQRKTLEETDINIVDYCIENRFASANDIQSNVEGCEQVTTRTVRNRLLEAGLRARRPARKIAISEINRERRLQWANEHLHWSSNDWERVAFSDESKFCLSNGDVQYVRRYIGERYEDYCVVETENRSVASVIVWGALFYSGATRLVRLDGRVNSAQYIEVLERELLPHCGEFTLFQQDNAPIHNSRQSKEFFRDNNVEVLSWSPQSPDMNCIENVWGRMAQILQREYEKSDSSDQLFATLVAIWNDLVVNNREYRQTLISTMPRRVAALKDAQGGHTHY